MTRLIPMLLAATAAIGLAVVATPAAAQQSGAVRAAIAAGTVGEKADGYLGIRGDVSAAVRAEVDSINIRRRALYTERVAGRPVSVEQMAAAIGCRTLATRVQPGNAYQSDDGTWRVRGEGDPPPTSAACPAL